MMSTSTKPLESRAYHHGHLKEALVDGALGLLAETGLAEFSVAKVAKRIKVSQAAPYRHFRDRIDFLAAVAVRSTTMLTEALTTAVDQAEKTPEEQLAATAGAYTRFVLEHGVGLELTFSPELRGREHARVHQESRALMSFLLSLAHAASADPSFNASLVLLEGHLAIAEGFAAMQRRGALAFQSLASEEVAEHAAAASLTFIRGARAAAHHRISPTLR